VIRTASYPDTECRAVRRLGIPLSARRAEWFLFYISQPGKGSGSKGPAQGPPITGDKMSQAPLEPSNTCLYGHDKFSGTISDLKSKASFGCPGCSIVYEGLNTLDGPCIDFSNCTVDWKSRDKETLAVLVRHRCNLKNSSKTPRAIEFIHKIGPFSTLSRFRLF
jgi:hypothetical protein